MWPIKITLAHRGADLGLTFLPDDYCFAACHDVFKCTVNMFHIQHLSSDGTPTVKFKSFFATIIHIQLAGLALLI